MSLQLWLPMCRDLSNKGLPEIELTSSDVSFSGNHAEVMNQLDTKLPWELWDYINGSVSFALWLKINKADIEEITSMYTYDSTYATAGGTVIGHDSYGGFSLRWKTNNLYTGSLSTINMYVHLRDSNTTLLTSSNKSVSFDEWHHVAVTLDKKNNLIRVYWDGELYTSNSVDMSALTDDTMTSSRKVTAKINYPQWDGGNGRPCQIPIKMRDVRIYNNCLSLKEVKRLSEGLYVHYKLDGNGMGNPNLIKGFASGGHTTIQDNKQVTIAAQEKVSDTYFRIYLSEAIQADTPYTLSCKAKGNNCTADWYFPLFSQSNPIATQFCLKAGADFNSLTFTVPTGSSYVGSKEIFMDDLGRPTTNPNDIILYDFKLEKGSEATTWVPNSTTDEYELLGLGANREADCSGFENHAVKVGDVTVNSNTKHYKYSSYLNSTNVGTSTTSGASFIRGTLYGPLEAPEELTINWWGNVEDYHYQNSGILSLSNISPYPTDYTASTLAQFDSVFRFNTSSSYANLSATSLIVTGEWHMYTLMFDGSYVKSYRDGVLIESKSLTGPLLSSAFVYLGINVAGGAYRQTKGYWSDFRIYTKALSEDDLKRMFISLNSVDKNGNFLTYEIREV